jgi:hypothetical protein
MSGLGAWSFGYYRHGMAVPNDRVAAGIKAFKQALIDNGYSKGIDVDLPVFGSNMDKNTRAFQADQSLEVDGVIGPNTAHLLLRLYAYQQEQVLHIPNHYTAKQLHLESGDDPVAEGYTDAEDEGWAQLHMPFYPGISLAQAWTPSFAAAKLAAEQSTFYAKTPDWDGAIAAWNVGAGTAALWVKAGKPATGVIVNGVDYAPRATKYVALVKQQPA